MQISQTQAQILALQVYYQYQHHSFFRLSVWACELTIFYSHIYTLICLVLKQKKFEVKEHRICPKMLFCFISGEERSTVIHVEGPLLSDLSGRLRTPVRQAFLYGIYGMFSL